MTVVKIDPVSRIEGHAKITIRLDDDGRPVDTRFHVTEFRGFEAFCVGRPVWEMPSLTARTCGICPASHLLASAKAGDGIMGVRIPDNAVRLRRIANLGQIIQSHSLSFFHLSSPDLLLGFDADPASRNVFGLMEADPDFARRGIRLRGFGQRVLEAIAGRKVHSPGVVPGGVASPMTAETRQELIGYHDEVLESITIAIERFEQLLDRHDREIRSFGTFPSYFMALANADGRWEHYDGHLQVIDSEGSVVADHVDAADYRTLIGEASNADSYLKSPYLKPMVEEGGDISAGLYRVGPLARVNMCRSMGAPLADAALERFRERAGGPHGIATSSFMYHYARLIEILACIERMQEHLSDDDVLNPMVRASAQANHRHAVGFSEAPRGTLFHEYHVDEHGLVEKVNMIIATGQNNLAMNATVHAIAQEYIDGTTVDGTDIAEPVLNRIEAGIRAYDPCLSCSTHALGRMPIAVTVVDSGGRTLAEHVRG